jgi:predicted alpha/beta superfamily hydrolase
MGRAGVRRALFALALLASVAAARASSGAPAEPVTVRFEADLRAEAAAGRFDPARDRVELRGGFPPLAWDRGLPMAPAADGRWALDLRFERRPAGGQPVPHKFRIVRAGQGPNEGWEPGANHAARLDGAAPRVARVFGEASPAAPTRHTGTVLTLEPLPAGHALARPVWVWLPPGYEAEPARRYPVLYLHDGQNVFDAASAGAEWAVDETAQRLVLAGAVQPFIVVAVPSGRARIDELTPTPGGARAGHQGGRLRAYGEWLLDALKPEIDRRFRTRPEAAHTAVGGSSLGGVASLWLALHRADRVGAALVVSPSVWWDGFLPRRDVLATTPPEPRPRLWLDMGAHEGEGIFAESRALRDALAARGWAGTRLAYVEDPDGRHDELSWAARVDGMLRFLFAPLPAGAAGRP